MFNVYQSNNGINFKIVSLESTFEDAFPYACRFALDMDVTATEIEKGIISSKGEFPYVLFNRK